MKTNLASPTVPAPHPFLHQHQDQVLGVLHGLDRVRLQGSLRCLYHRDLFRQYLYELKVLWKDFKAFACDLTARVHQSAVDLARAAGRPYCYLRSCNLSKEQWITDLLARGPVREGLIAVLGYVEPCAPTRSMATARPRSWNCAWKPAAVCICISTSNIRAGAGCTCASRRGIPF